MDTRKRTQVRTAVIACEMSRLELTRVMDETNAVMPVFWLEPGLHNTPELLRARLQTLMDEYAAQFDCYLLAMGQCGNATEGLRTGDYCIVLPRVDDCITLLLGSLARRREIFCERPTYFLTEGWMHTEKHNILAEYQRALKKYGAKRAKMIFQDLLLHYKRLGLLDTGCYDIQALREQIGDFAAEFDLEIETISATDVWLRALLHGPWTAERFCIAPPHSELHMRLT